jgi:hypothetical protein
MGSSMLAGVGSASGVGSATGSGLAILAGSINLSRRLTVSRQPVETDGASERAFARALGLLDIGATKPANPLSVLVDPLPSEDGPSNECLARLKNERPAFELAAIEPKHIATKSDEPLRSIKVPYQTALMSASQIIHVPAACVADVRPGDDFTSKDGPSVIGDRIGKSSS